MTWVSTVGSAPSTTSTSVRPRGQKRPARQRPAHWRGSGWAGFFPTVTATNPNGDLYGWGFWLVWALLGVGVVLLGVFAFYTLRLSRATRPSDASAPKAVRDWVRWGAGPRAGQALLLGAKARALLDGRMVPALDDVTAVALPVLRHRVLVNFQAEADGIGPDQVITRLLESVQP